jgi:hypothetical protein
MPRYKYLVLTNPAPGREEEYNRWYTDVHIGEVTAIAGFTGASRYRIVPGEGRPEPSHRYLAIYDLETDNVDGVLRELMDSAASGGMQMSDAIDLAAVTYLYEALPDEAPAR